MPGSWRIAAAWLLAVPFLLLARPTTPLLAVSTVLSVVGLIIRGWAAGSIDKGASLAVGGPYAYTRNPLYLGSFVIGMGLSAAGGRWAWPVLFAFVFVAVYVPTLRREASELTERFGDRYRDYRAEVPAYGVRLTPYRSTDDGSQGGGRLSFSWQRYVRYREWEAALGVASMLVVLAVKARFGL